MEREAKTSRTGIFWREFWRSYLQTMKWLLPPATVIIILIWWFG